MTVGLPKYHGISTQRIGCVFYVLTKSAAQSIPDVLSFLLKIRDSKIRKIK